MTTLEHLYFNAADTREYDAARAAKLAEIVAYVAPFLRDGVNAQVVAAAIMESAEEMGRINGDTIDGEVAGRYTISGNPLPFSL